MLRGISKLLLALGIIALLTGFIMLLSPSIVEKTVTLPHTEIIFDDRLYIEPFEYYYSQFSIPSSAKSAYLDVEIIVYSGKDVDFEVYYQGSKYIEKRVVGSYYDTIKLPGPGPYEVRLDNSFSVITSKDVGAKVTLRWSEVKIERQQVESKGGILMLGGFILLIAGGAVYALASRVERIEKPEEVLIDLASRKPVAESGNTITKILYLENKNLSQAIITKLLEIIEKTRHVGIDTHKPRFSKTYKLTIKGIEDNVNKAISDIHEFCKRTQKCKVMI